MDQNSDWESQEKLMKETVLHKLNTNFPLKTDYQIAFLKHLINKLEQHTEEIHDLIYENLGQKLKEENPEFSFKHFLISGLHGEEVITIKEANSFIRDGTTGLKLWPAAMALGEFVLQNQQLFKGKSILELGSGATGFVGMLLLKTCRPRKVYLSDCHDSVIQTLAENINQNLMSYSTKPMDKSLLIQQRYNINNKHEVAVLSLPWEDVDKYEEELKTVCEPEVLLAADVVYDETIFDALIKCIMKLFEFSEPSMVFYLSQTIRNKETHKKFCNLLQHDFELFETEINQRTFYWQPTSEIKILRITKRRKENAYNFSIQL